MKILASVVIILSLCSGLQAWPKKTKPAPSNVSSSSAAVAASSSTSSSSAGATASNQGNNTKINETETYKEIRQTPPAYAPDAYPTAPCIKGFSGGASSPLVAGSIGGGKIDQGCDSRETARVFALMGNQEAAAKILCSTDAAKRAHLTIEDCLKSTPAPIVVSKVEVPPTINISQPAPTLVITPVPPAPPIKLTGVVSTQHLHRVILEKKLKVKKSMVCK